MNEATIALTVMTFLIFLIFLFFLVWGIRSGQFRNVEEAKFIPFRGDQEAAGTQDSDATEGDGIDPDDEVGKADERH